MEDVLDFLITCEVTQVPRIHDACKGRRAFEIALSVEMEGAAHKTLSLRSFTRQFPPNKLPDEYYQFAAGKISQDELLEEYPAKWKMAQKEALRATLGTPEAAKLIYPSVDRIKKSAKGRTILIGGPPCQAYSLVGRSRNAGNSEYKAQDDGRHFLYREYIDILNRLRPAAFVMENVKGILSSAVSGSGIFERILNDLERVGEEGGGYKLVALVPNRNGKPSSKMGLHPSDFIVRAEQHSIPQSRHRVFVVGLRADVAASLEDRELETLLEFGIDVSVENVLAELPFLRSGLSKDEDTSEAWQQAIVEAAELLLTVDAPSGSGHCKVLAKVGSEPEPGLFFLIAPPHQ